MHDKYGRLLARVLVGEQDVSQVLVREGMAWHFLRYSSDAVLAEAERRARDSHIGLWREDKPIPPWEWRIGDRATDSPQPERTNSDEPDLRLHGNVHSHIYHLPPCSQFNCRNCTRVFRSREEAAAAGYRPAGCCNRTGTP